MARRRSACPCGLPATYADCCGRFHAGGRAPTPELLMRSRYSAFAVGDTAYLLRTWHPATRPAELHLEPGLRWTGLEVLETGPRTVRFAAHYVDGREPGTMEENSRFAEAGGAWVYVGPVSRP